MGIMRSAFHRAGRWGVIIVLCLLASGAWAAEKDWLDEMPCVPMVVQAVRENIRDLRLDENDEDARAADIVGTLMLLRWIMYFQVVEEGREPMPRMPMRQQTLWLLEKYVAGTGNMSKQRLDKLKSLEAAYMQAELVIGRGTGKQRSGFLTSRFNCNISNTFNALAGEEKLTCYQGWFYRTIDMIYPSINHRRRILPKLFPSDRAAQYVELVTRYVSAAKSPGDIAITLSMPPGSGYPMPGSDYCTTNSYGGDSNGNDRKGNGLCDDWEKPLSSTSGTVQANFKKMCKSCLESDIFGQKFDSIEEAARAALDKAWIETVKSAQTGPSIEWGGVIYWVAPKNFSGVVPINGQQRFIFFRRDADKDFRYMAPISGNEKSIPAVDMKAAWKVVQNSAECTGRKVELVANYHTHPIRKDPSKKIESYLSLDDINSAITKKDEILGYNAVYMRGENANTCGIHKYEDIHGHGRIEPLSKPKADEYEINYFGSQWVTYGYIQQRDDYRRSATEWIPLKAGQQLLQCDSFGNY